MEWYHYVLIVVGIALIGSLKLKVFAAIKNKKKSTKYHDED